MHNAECTMQNAQCIILSPLSSSLSSLPSPLMCLRKKDALHNHVRRIFF